MLSSHTFSPATYFVGPNLLWCELVGPGLASMSLSSVRSRCQAPFAAFLLSLGARGVQIFANLDRLIESASGPGCVTCVALLGPPGSPFLLTIVPWVVFCFLWVAILSDFGGPSQRQLYLFVYALHLGRGQAKHLGELLTCMRN